jgi:hypothetical protein
MEENKKADRPEDINSQSSTKTGFSGIFENAFRKFKDLGFLLVIAPIGILYILCIGLALTPGLIIMSKIHAYLILTNANIVFSSFMYGIGVGLIFVTFVFSLIFIVPIFNLPLIPFVKPYRRFF